MAAAAAAAGSGNPMDVSHHHHHHNDNLNPYWPELPLPAVSVPYPNEELRINNDHSSIRRLLIKLGGKFSEDMNEQPLHQLPIDVSSVQQESSYDHDFLPSAPMNHHPRPEFDHEYNNMEAGGGLQMLQGQNGSFLAQLEEMVCSSSNPGRLDGMEFLYHPQPQEMTHLKPGPTGGNNYYGQSLMISWGETSSVVYPDPDLVASNYGGGGLHQQAQAGSLTQAHVFDALRYPTPQ